MHLGTFEHARLQSWIEAFGVDEINAVAPEKAGKLILDLRKPEIAHRRIRGEFDENINIAVRAKVLAQYGAKKRQLADVISSTEPPARRLQSVSESTIASKTPGYPSRRDQS